MKNHHFNIDNINKKLYNCIDTGDCMKNQKTNKKGGKAIEPERESNPKHTFALCQPYRLFYFEAK